MEALTDLASITSRAERAQHWCTTTPEPPHVPLGFVPLSTRQHFEHDMPALVNEIQELRAKVAELEAWQAAARQAGRNEAAADIRNMGTLLGDTGWAELERRADEAEWPRSYLREMRNADRSFATCTVEVTYQSTRDRAARIAEGKTT